VWTQSAVPDSGLTRICHRLITCVCVGGCPTAQLRTVLRFAGMTLGSELQALRFLPLEFVASTPDLRWRQTVANEMQGYRASQAPAASALSMLNVESTPSAGDPYANLQKILRWQKNSLRRMPAPTGPPMSERSRSLKPIRRRW
jgi:hypothetical protein